MNAFLKSIEIILPVVLTLAIGRVYALARGFSGEMARGIGSLVFWVCLPALTFREIVRSGGVSFSEWKLCAGLFAVIVGCALIGYRYARLTRAAENKVGVIAQGSFRSNMMYVGLPVLMYYAQARGAANNGGGGEALRERIAQLTAVSAAVSIPLLNVATIFVFELPRRKRPEHTLTAGKIVRSVALNPLVLSVACAALVQTIAGGKEFFDANRIAGTTLDTCAAAALPLALFSIGALLDVREAFKGLRETLPVAGIKLLLMPALGLGLFLAMGLRGAPLAVGLVLLACPDASIGHAMAAEYGGDEELAAELVAVTTLICPFTLVGWLSVLAWFE